MTSNTSLSFTGDDCSQCLFVDFHMGGTYSCRLTGKYGIPPVSGGYYASSSGGISNICPMSDGIPSKCPLAELGSTITIERKAKQ